MTDPQSPTPVSAGLSETVKESLRQALAWAYTQGATDVHNEWVREPGEAPRGDPDFAEAADDYARAAVDSFSSAARIPEELITSLHPPVEDAGEKIRAEIVYAVQTFKDPHDVAEYVLTELRHQHATPDPTPLYSAGEVERLRPIEIDMMRKGLRRNPKYVPSIGETCRMSGPNCDDADGYTWSSVEVLWRDDLFIVTRVPGCWPTITKLELALFEPQATPIPSTIEPRSDGGAK